MILTQAERDSALWKKVVAELDRRLGDYRAHNDKTSLSESETARIRGRIAEVKSLLEINSLTNTGQFET